MMTAARCAWVARRGWVAPAKEGVRTWCLSLLDGDGGKINYVFFNSFLNSSVPNDEMMIGTIILSSGAHT
jgi:hypothetical protein